MAELFPTPIIQGEKIWLRAMERRDAEALARSRNDKELGFEAGFSFPENRIGFEKQFERLMSEEHGKGGFHFTICLLGHDEALGFASLRGIHYINSNAEFSIFLANKEHLDKGFGTDALNATLDFGFSELPLERIYLHVRKENKRAIRSYEKAGLVVEGTLRKEKRFQGKLVDMLIMSILREEWAGLERKNRAT